MSNISSLKSMLSELNIELAKMENEAAGMTDYPQTQKVFNEGIMKTREVIKQVHVVLLTQAAQPAQPAQPELLEYPYPQLMPVVLPVQQQPAQQAFLPPQQPAQQPYLPSQQIVQPFVPPAQPANNGVNEKITAV